MREEMQVGDLVRCNIGDGGDADSDGFRVGIITGFDEDDDPIVCYYNQKPYNDTFYRYHVEVINEAI